MGNLSGFRNFFRTAQWITPQRSRLYCLLFLVLISAMIGGLLVTSHSGIDANGKILGTDFISFWAASDLALHGHPADVYQMHAHEAQQLKIFPQASQSGYTAFFYPPLFLLICLPLAVFPYLVSLCLWLSVTGYACWRAVKGFLPEKTSWVFVASFPAIFINILHGQNAFLTCALFAGAVYLLGKSPVVSGIFFGLLCFKPHLALCVPFALTMARQWRALCAFIMTVVVFVLVSWGLFGTATWLGFLQNIPFATATLEKNYVGYGKMVSIFAAVRLLHGSLFVSYFVQAVTAFLVFSVLMYIAFYRRASQATGVMLIITALVVTPFLLDYDLMLLAPVLAWLARQAQLHGFLPYERFLLAFAFLMPLFVRYLALSLNVPVGPVILLAVAYMVARRALGQTTVCLPRGVAVSPV